MTCFVWILTLHLPPYARPLAHSHLVVHLLVSIRLVLRLLDVGKFLKHDLELFEVNLAVSVDIDFLDHTFPNTLLLADVVAKNGSDLLRLDRTTAVLVEELEGSQHIRLAQQFNLVDGSSAPLTKVDFTASVDIGLVEDFVGFEVNDLLVLHRVQGTVSLEELFALDEAVTILVELVERVTELHLLLFGGEMTGHKGQSRLLQL